MAWFVKSNHKCCATCCHLAGPRDVNPERDTLATPNEKYNAKCFVNANAGGFPYGPMADYCCENDYLKWPTLK